MKEKIKGKKDDATQPQGDSSTTNVTNVSASNVNAGDVALEVNREFARYLEKREEIRKRSGRVRRSALIEELLS